MPTCKECRHWKPDAFIETIGECEKKGGAKHEEQEKCDIYEVIVDEEFMWCRECRTMVHRSDKPKHGGHRLHASVHTDHDAHEYLSAGD